jgi:hypothetical protein
MYLDFATGFNLPPFWADHPVTILGADAEAKAEDSGEYLGNLYQDTLRMRPESGSEWYTFPFDPVISVTCRNNIIRRDVLKVDVAVIRRGSVKEVWSQDDYEVNIAGLFIGNAGEGTPEAHLRQLREFCEAREVVEVESTLFSIFGITRLAIADYSLPFTKGLENQQFVIKAYSDEFFELLVME